MQTLDLTLQPISIAHHQGAEMAAQPIPYNDLAEYHSHILRLPLCRKRPAEITVTGYSISRRHSDAHEARETYPEIVSALRVQIALSRWCSARQN
jgi:hypothetical protein